MGEAKRRRELGLASEQEVHVRIGKREGGRKAMAREAAARAIIIPGSSSEVVKDGKKVRLPFLKEPMKTAFDATRFKRDARNAARDEALAKVEELRDHAKEVQAKEGFIDEQQQDGIHTLGPGDSEGGGGDPDPGVRRT